MQVTLKAPTSNLSETDFQVLAFLEIRKCLNLPIRPRLIYRNLIFPFSFAYDLSDGRKPYLSATTNTLQIFTAISLFYTGHRNLTDDLIHRLNEWEDHFCFDRFYFIGERTAVKFTPEQSIEIQFPDSAHAAVFYYKFLIAGE